MMLSNYYFDSLKEHLYHESCTKEEFQNLVGDIQLFLKLLEIKLSSQNSQIRGNGMRELNELKRVLLKENPQADPDFKEWDI